MMWYPPSMDTPGNLQEPEDVGVVFRGEVEYFSFELNRKVSPHDMSSAGTSIVFSFLGFNTS